MKLGSSLLLMVGLTVVCTGCANVVQVGPGAVSDASVFTNVTYPNTLQPEMEDIVELSADDVEIVGPLEGIAGSGNMLVRFFGSATSGAFIIFGGGEATLLAWGDSGFGKAFERLRRKEDVDGIMNKYVDSEYWKLDLGLVRVDKIATKIGGVGYRLKNKPALSR